MAKIRILRVLEYEGEEELLWHTLKKGGVPANGEYTTTNITIRSATIGYPSYQDWQPMPWEPEVNKNG